jgi:hypothetical protein
VGKMGGEAQRGIEGRPLFFASFFALFLALFEKEGLIAVKPYASLSIPYQQLGLKPQ